MPLLWTPKDLSIYKDWLSAIENEASDKLNSWELRFITDVGIRLNNNIQLTQLQAEKLEQIYADKTS